MIVIALILITIKRISLRMHTTTEQTIWDKVRNLHLFLKQDRIFTQLRQLPTTNPCKSAIPSPSTQRSHRLRVGGSGWLNHLRTAGAIVSSVAICSARPLAATLTWVMYQRACLRRDHRKTKQLMCKKERRLTELEEVFSALKNSVRQARAPSSHHSSSQTYRILGTGPL